VTVLQERVRDELRQQFADLFAAAGVDDALPASMTVDHDRRVCVESRSRGRIEIGRVDERRLLGLASTYATEIEAVLAKRAAGVARGFTDEQIRATVQALRQEFGRAPTREETAVRLNTSEATLKRAVYELGMGKWPPTAPSD